MWCWFTNGNNKKRWNKSQKKLHEKERKQVKIIQFLQEKKKREKQKALQSKERFLEVYLTRHYEIADANQIAIPAFIKAKKEVARLKENGLLDEAYKQAKGLIK